MAEIYESVKFQCSVCGLRFIRNMTLKKHLDNHFARNNEHMRRQKGNRTVGRPQFMGGVADFTNVSKNKREEKEAQASNALPVAGLLSTVKDVIPYNSHDVSIYSVTNVI